MILLLEADKNLSKKLCDLLDRERIICIESGQQILEMVVKYKNDINAIIANNNQFHEIMAHHVILKLCQKLQLKPPPVVCYYEKNDSELHEEYLKDLGLYKLIECDGADPGFPEKFITTLKEVYPGLNADVKKASVMWFTKPEELVDLGRWLREEGFFRGPETAPPAGTGAAGTVQKSGPDYEKMYRELKKKYDELKKEHDDLVEQVKDIIDLENDSKKK